jgi:IS30 family transposase
MECLDNWKTDIKTIKADNGKEFAGRKILAENLEIDYYVARPYRSWERDSNENLNGWMRQYLPEKTDFTKITKDQVRSIKEK